MARDAGMLLLLFGLTISVQGGLINTESGLAQNDYQINSEEIKSLYLNEKVDGPCAFCKFFVKQIDIYLEKPGTMIQIYERIYGMCMGITHIEVLCKKLGQEILQVYKQMIDTTMNPTEACSKAGFCKQIERQPIPTINSSATLISLLDQGDELSIKPLCDFCQLVVRRIDHYALNCLNTTRGQAESLCHRLTPPTDQECLKVVEFYYKDVSKDFEEGGLFGPAAVCTKEIPVCRISYP